MNLTWNLDDLFESNEDFYDEIEKIKRALSDIKKYANVEVDEKFFLEMLDKKWKIKELANNVLIYGSLMYYKNIKSEECLKLKSDAETFNNQVNLELNFIDIKILGLGKKKVYDLIAKNPNLKIYEFSLIDLFRRQEHVVDNQTNIKIKRNNDEINSQLNFITRLLEI